MFQKFVRNVLTTINVRKEKSIILKPNQTQNLPAILATLKIPNFP